MAEGVAKFWKRAEPKKESHRFESAVGYCPECGAIEARNLNGVLEHLRDIRKYLVDATNDRKWVCKNCGFGVAHDRAELDKISSCPLCESPTAAERTEKK